MKPYLPLLGVFACLAALPAAAQADRDPVGEIRQGAAASVGHDVLVGRDAANRPVCFRREQGDSHRLDIGIGADGAFVRLDTPEPRESTARSPVRVYAGLQQVEDGKATERFMVLAPFAGEVRFFVPQADRASFTILATGDPAPFLAVVAAARDNLLVIDSRQPPPAREYVAVYAFDRAAADVLIACARQHVR